MQVLHVFLYLFSSIRSDDTISVSHLQISTTKTICLFNNLDNVDNKGHSDESVMLLIPCNNSRRENHFACLFSLRGQRSGSATEQDPGLMVLHLV